MQHQNPYKIGIVGADTSHVSAFVEYIKNDARFQRRFEIAGVVDDGLSRVDFYRNRRSSILASLPDSMPILTLESMPDVDAWWILAGDADSHLDILKALTQTHKPIFIDKPIVYNMTSFTEMKQYIRKHDLRVYSSSALRFTQLVTNAYARFETTTHIVIEGPLTFVDGIPSYHWYGIHCLEMLYALSAEVTIKKLEINDTYEYLSGTISDKTFEIRWIKVGDPPFKIFMDDAAFELQESLYEGLIHVLCEAIESDSLPVPLESTQRIMKTLDKLNLMRTKILNKDN